MHICLVTLDFPPFRSSGLTIYAEKVALGLVARGHRVTVVAARRAESGKTEDVELPENLSVVRVPVGPADWIGLGWNAARYLRSRCDAFDVVHFTNVHFAYAHRGPFVASAFQSFRQQLTSHHGLPYHSDWRNFLFRLTYYQGARWAMERPAVRRARHIMMSSRATQQEFVENYNVALGRTTLVYLGIDPYRFDPLPDRAEARRQLGLPEETAVILYIGFSTPRKGVEYLAQALSLMKKRTHLVMVGKWESNYWKRFVDALGDVRDQIHIAGYVPDADLGAFFASADAFVLPTLLEGFGIPLVEAMAAGLPTVTTSAGSAGEIVGDAGLVVPPSDSQALASALDQVLAEPELARQLSQTGQNRVRELFDERRMASEIEAVYQHVQDTHQNDAVGNIQVTQGAVK